MYPSQAAIFGVGINPIDGNGTTPTGVAFDTAPDATGKMTDVMAIVQLGNIAANMTTLKIEMSDNNSDWVDLTGYGFTAPTAAAGDNTIRVAFINAQGSVRRYLRVSATCGAGATLISAVWVGFRSGQAPSSNTERGLAASIFPS